MIGCARLQAVEKTFFRTINRYLEPTIRAGIGSPWLVPVGAIVMETVGRKSGKIYNIPVVASAYGQWLVASTVRGNSQWIRNVAAVPEIHVWLRGKRRACSAYVISDGQLSQPLQDDTATGIRLLVDNLKLLSSSGCASFVLLAMEPASQAESVAKPVAV